MLQFFIIKGKVAFIFSGSFEVSNLGRMMIIAIFMPTGRQAAVNHANNLDLANFLH